MESFSLFPFHKFRYDKYLTLDVLLYVNHQEVLKYFFDLNKEGRNYIIQNFITIRNEFNNNGLIDCHFFYS